MKNNYTLLENSVYKYSIYQLKLLQVKMQLILEKYLMYLYKDIDLNLYLKYEILLSRI